MRRYFWRILPGEAGLGAADGDLAGQGAGAADGKRGCAHFLPYWPTAGAVAARMAARRGATDFMIQPGGGGLPSGDAVFLFGWFGCGAVIPAKSGVHRRA